MIIYLSTERFSATMRYYVDYFRAAIGETISVLSYEELFFEQRGPIAHYIFTDFDRLSRYELECAAAFAISLRKAAPDAQILNHPLKVLERFPLLVALHRAGINDFTAIRLETGERPDRYPVFIRAEDGYAGPETGLIEDDTEFDAALDDLSRRGLPRRGRIAIGFANKRSQDGYFHKYGAFNIGGRIVPHDLMFGEDWIVKIRMHDGAGWTTGRDEAYGASAEGTSKELAYIHGNPHAKILKRVFSIAGIDYGRADYGLVDGRVQVYEINTNPHLTYHESPDGRAERLAIVQRQTIEALLAINTSISNTGHVTFRLPRPKAHNLHWPRRRLPVSLARKLVRRLVYR